MVGRCRGFVDARDAGAERPLFRVHRLQSRIHFSTIAIFLKEFGKVCMLLHKKIVARGAVPRQWLPAKEGTDKTKGLPSWESSKIHHVASSR
jgi:hypothetical protein